MNDALLDAGIRPRGDKITIPGRFLGKTPLLLGGFFAIVLIAGLLWGAIWRMESSQRIETNDSIIQSAPQVSNSLGEYLPEERPEPLPEPLAAPVAEVLPPVLSEAQQAQQEFLQKLKMQEWQNRVLGTESTILISTKSLREDKPPTTAADQPQAMTIPPPVDRTATLNPALAALAASAGEGPKDEQAEKLAFLDEGETASWSTHTRQTDLGRYTLKTGTVIPSVLISGLNSDLPGNVIAQVSQHVYDSATGRYLLIPQGAKLYGTYDSRVSYGQNRALVIWERIIYPDASTLDLDRSQGVDISGYSGFKDKVNNHYLRTFGQMFLLSAIQAAPGQISGDSQTSGDDEFSRITAVNTSKMGEKLIDRNLSIQPTIRIRPGYPFLIMVNKDILFRGAYRV